MYHHHLVTWRAQAAAQAGVISRRQLRTHGVSDDAVDRLSVAGGLIRLARGVYLVGGAPDTFQARLRTAVLSTDGILALATAGRLWGVLDGDGGPVHVVVPPDRRVHGTPSTVVHYRRLPVGAIRLRSELPVTERRCTVLDLLATLPAADAGRLADRALQRGWVARKDVSARLRDHPRAPGNRQLRRIADQLGDGAAAHSERVLHGLLRRAGIGGWTPNYEVWARGELVAVVDVALRERGIAIEVDGMAFHVDVTRFRRDRSRQNALVALGWTVLRFTWADLTERPGYVVAMIQRLAA